MVCSEALFMIVKLDTLVLMGKLVTLIHNSKKIEKSSIHI